MRLYRLPALSPPPGSRHGVRPLVAVIVASVALGACASGAHEPSPGTGEQVTEAASVDAADAEEAASDAAQRSVDETGAPGQLALADGSQPPPAPAAPSGPLDPGLVAELDKVFGGIRIGSAPPVSGIGQSGDARVAARLLATEASAAG